MVHRVNWSVRNGCVCIFGGNLSMSMLNPEMQRQAFQMSMNKYY